MTTARVALRYKKLAKVYEKWADAHALMDEPWSGHNVRLWQSYMAGALASRSIILREYLHARALRS